MIIKFPIKKSVNPGTIQGVPVFPTSDFIGVSIFGFLVMVEVLDLVSVSTKFETVYINCIRSNWFIFIFLFHVNSYRFPFHI